MGYPSGPTRPVLTKGLEIEPKKYTFNKAVELIEAAFDDKPDMLSYAKQPYLFRANPSFGFPSSDINSVNLLSDGHYEVVVNFMGLYGPSSPLPDFYTQDVIDELVSVDAENLSTFHLRSISELKAYQENRSDLVKLRKRADEDTQLLRSKQVERITLSPAQQQELRNGTAIDLVLTASQYNKLFDKQAIIQIHHAQCANQRDFLDVFNHRLVSLYLEATRKYRPHEMLQVRNDYNIDILMSLIGAPNKSEREKSPINWAKLLHFSGLLSLKQGSSEVIRKVIAGYFELGLENIKVEENVLREISIPEHQLNRLGQANNRLGSTFLCGTRIKERTSKFRVHLYALNEAQFYLFLPPTSGSTEPVYNRHQELKAVLNFIKSPEQNADIALHLHKTTRLAFNLKSDSMTLLGYSSWLNPNDNHSCHVVV